MASDFFFFFNADQKKKKDMSRIYLNSGWLEVPWGDGDLGMLYTPMDP